jgi:phospholipase C
MSDIEHVVVLMLENRSFDSMLGWLYERPEDFAAVNVVGASSGPAYNGLQGLDLSQFVNTDPSTGMSSPPLRGTPGFTAPSVDPGETFEHVDVQFFGPDGKAKPMTGYLADFVAAMRKLKLSDDEIRLRATEVLASYTQGQLPVLNQLAKHYAVCDGWYASIPSQTNGNRAFSLCGTSMGLVNNGQLEEDPRAKQLESLLGMGIGDDRFITDTIFNFLATENVDWAVYWQTSYLPHKLSKLIDDLPYLIPVVAALGPVFPPAAGLSILLGAALIALSPYADYLAGLSADELTSCFTWRLFPRIQNIPGAGGRFHRMEEFHRQARAGTLPKFSYLEPYWTIAETTIGTTFGEQLKHLFYAMGNDYHPPSNLLLGEQFLKDVYTSLISNRQAWEKTLLVVTFDEFVGSFDHVEPPATATPPWGDGPAPPISEGPVFDFKRFGGRVPAILVSPLVAKNTVFRAPEGSAPYDHTSVIKTTMQWIGKAADFGQRTANAPAFGEVVSLSTPRTDERDLAFLDTPRKTGDPVGYGETIVLRNQSGAYLSTAVKQLKSPVGAGLPPNDILDFAVDLDLGAYYPTLGGPLPALLSLHTRAVDPSATIADGSKVLITTHEAAVSANNVLGAWSDSWDTYYYNLYLEGPYVARQDWIIHQAAPARVGQPLCYGDVIRLECAGSPGNMLSHDWRPSFGGWVMFSSWGPDTWTVAPAVHEVLPRSVARVVSWQDGFQSVAPGNVVDGSNCVVLQPGQFVVSKEDGFQTCTVGERVDGHNCVILTEGQRVVSWDDGYQTCKPGSVVDGSHVVILEAGQFVVSMDDGFQTCRKGAVVDGTTCVVLNAGDRVASNHDGFKTCKPGTPIDNRTCVILRAGQRVVSYQDGYLSCPFLEVVDGSDTVILDADQKVVSYESGYQTCKPGNIYDGQRTIILGGGDRVVSWETVFQSLQPGSVVDGSNVIVLHADQRVVSTEDGFQTCRLGRRVDNQYCVILNAGERVASWDGGVYQWCNAGSYVDGSNVVILKPGQRVVSSDTGFTACSAGSRVDGANVVIVDADQRVVSWDGGGYVWCRPGSYVDGSNVVVLDAGDRIASFEDGYHTCTPGEHLNGSTCVLLPRASRPR